MSDSSRDKAKPGRIEKSPPAADTQAARHIWGPRSLGAVLPPLLRPTFRKRAPATAQIIADWDNIVGPAIARSTIPRRLSAGTLVIACTGPIALELQHLSDVLMERINTHVGHVLVERLRFLQEASVAADVPRPPPVPSPQAMRAAEAAVSDLPEGALRDALAALGRSVLTRR